MARPPDDQVDWIVVGSITRTQGHRGAVRLFPFFEPVERFEHLNTRRVRWQPSTTGRRLGSSARPPRSLTIGSIRYHKQFVILTFDEIPDMTAAETLIGGEIAVARDELWAIEEGQFFTFDLVGLDVVDCATGCSLGTVEAVMPGGAQDLLKVRKRRDGATFLIPFVRPLITGVDLSARRVTVALPPGLEEL
jgi:16S rRNA processing protein RimM